MFWCGRRGCLVLEERVFGVGGGVLVWEVYIKCELTAVASL